MHIPFSRVSRVCWTCKQASRRTAGAYVSGPSRLIYIWHRPRCLPGIRYVCADAWWSRLHRMNHSPDSLQTSCSWITRDLHNYMFSLNGWQRNPKLSNFIPCTLSPPLSFSILRTQLSECEYAMFRPAASTNRVSSPNCLDEFWSWMHSDTTESGVARREFEGKKY